MLPKFNKSFGCDQQSWRFLIKVETFSEIMFSDKTNFAPLFDPFAKTESGVNCLCSRSVIYLEYKWVQFTVALD